jgi:hypothetical protein
MASKLSQADPRIALTNASEDRRNRFFHLVIALVVAPGLFLGGRVLSSSHVGSVDFWYGAFFFLSNAAWISSGVYGAIRQRTVLLSSNPARLTEECSYFGLRSTREIRVERYTRIDVLRGNRGRHYAIQLASSKSNAREWLLDVSDLPQAEGVALHLASVFSLPAYVFDFESPRDSDRRFARQLNI